jgi:hypothetical protein
MKLMPRTSTLSVTFVVAALILPAGGAWALPGLCLDLVPAVVSCVQLPVCSASCLDLADCPLPTVLACGSPPDPCPQEGHEAAPNPLCPQPWVHASCVGHALAVRVRAPALPDSWVTEGDSAAAAAAYGQFAYSSGSGAGALANAGLGGVAQADTLASHCSAWAQANGDFTYRFATSHAEVQGVNLLGGLVMATVLDDDSTVWMATPMVPTGSDIVQLCAPLVGCITSNVPPNTQVSLAPGVVAVLNERGYAPTPDGRLLTWGAAVHILAPATGGSPAADVYVSYTAVAA